MARLDKVGNSHPKIERIAVTHDPPPVPESESQIAPAKNPGSRISSPALYAADTAAPVLPGA
jgi:hypothetical protein